MLNSDTWIQWARAGNKLRVYADYTGETVGCDRKEERKED
jgi:hypothetical protein